MGALRNNKWENFANLLVAGGRHDYIAYLESGYKDVPNNQAQVRKRASALKMKPVIQARMAELRVDRFRLPINTQLELDDLMSSETVIDRETIMRLLAKNISGAADAGDYKASNEAISLLGQTIGLFQKTYKSDKPEPQKRVALSQDEIVSSPDSILNLLSLMNVEVHDDTPEEKRLKTAWKDNRGE